MLLPLLVVISAAAVAIQYASAGPVPLLVSAGVAFVGAVLAFAVVWRSRSGAAPLIAALLILVNLTLVLRAIVTPR